MIMLMIMMMLLVILVNLMLFLLGGLLDSIFPLLTAHLMNLCFSLTGENQNAIKRLWRVSIRNLCKNLFFNSRGMFYFVIVKVLYILARILLFMVDLNILMYGIIGSMIFWEILNYWSLRRFIQMIMVQIWWQTLPKEKFETCWQFIYGLAFVLSWVRGGVCCVGFPQVSRNNILF